jgi:hypothetical protein
MTTGFVVICNMIAGSLVLPYAEIAFLQALINKYPEQAFRWWHLLAREKINF